MSENVIKNDIEFDEIWFFVEEKLKTPIPSYFKNVLKVCGFNNAITISSIDNEDIIYFENEVRNGNVTKYFEGNKDQNILEGCKKSVENFEFTLGHKKFLMMIKDFLKTYLEENGQDSVIPKAAEKRKLENPKARTRTEVPRKRIKHSVSESSIAECSPNDHYDASSVASSQNLMPEGLRRERSILLGKAIKSLISKTPEMYVKARVQEIEMANNKMSANLVTVEINRPSSGTLIGEVNEAIQYVGNITCPYCSKVIPVPHSTKQLPNGCLSNAWWNTSNFNSHLSLHLSYINREDEEHTENIDIFRDMNIALSQHNSQSDGTGSVEVNCSMLQNFVNSAERNSERRKPGYRYDILTKMFAAFIKMIAGLLAYETLQANFPLSLPSVSTVNRFIADKGPPIIEGEMRTGELKKFLQSRNLPMKISLSEDGTRITAKISYDPKTNQLIGFALPLDMNGMPIKFSYPARNAREIQNHFTNPSNFISTTAYVQMAQPIEPGSSPFCLMIYSTDNKFTANHVYKRWKFQAVELKEKGIKINNISTDGDPRTLMAMKVLSRIGQFNRSYFDCEWFSCGGYMETTFIQDVVHIITKARNRPLKCSRIFPIGDKVISLCHLKYLIKHISKDKHLLTSSDIEPKDRQNFLSAEKVCSKRTIECLLEYVPGSEGSALYLKVMRSILDSFLDNEIETEDRIYLIWYAVFFCRAWRSWLLNSEKSKISTNNKPKSYYNLRENFMSSTCYTCIELNAHALVKQVLAENSNEERSMDFDEDAFIDVPNEEVSSDKSQFIFPNLFGSQPCESMFRQVRSFTSTFCTVVNFNMLDIIHRIRKIQLQNDIINICNGEINFPRFEKKADKISAGQGTHPLKSLNRRKIISVIGKAKQAISCDLEKFGIDTSKLNFHCQIQPVHEEDLEKDASEIDNDTDSDCEESELQNEHQEEEEEEHIEAEKELQEDINFISGITGELNLKNYYTENFDEEGNLDEKCPFVSVADNSGTEQVVRKSSLVYVLSKDKHRLSSDRLQRVKEKEYSISNSTNKVIPSGDNFVVDEEIGIGEWCVFSQINEDEDGARDGDGEQFPILLGLVLDFTYLKGNTFKDREYSKVFAPVQANPVKEIGVLCNFYDFNDHGVLKSVAGHKHDFLKIESYLGTIKEPNYINKTLKISKNLVSELHKLIGL